MGRWGRSPHRGGNLERVDVKTKLRTMLLAAAGVLGSVAVAHAQPAPDPAPGPVPAPAPGAPPAPAPEPAAVAPAAMPAAPPPVAPPPVNWGGTPPPPAPDTTKPEAPPKPNPFALTRFTWNNSGSTKIFGVGADYNSTDDEVYSMDFGLNIRYTFFNEPKTKIFVNVAGGVEVELTNSDSTLLKREPRLRDTSAGVGVTRKVFATADKESSTSLQLSTSAVLPTSPVSRRQGRYFGTSLSGSVFHNQKLAGSKSDWFPSVFLFGNVNWGHNFSRAYTPTSTELAVTQRPRQVSCNGEAGCSSDASDQLGGISLSHDTLRVGGAFYLTIYKDLSLGNYWDIAERYKYAFADTCVNLPTTKGCEPAGRLSDATTRGALTTFDIQLSYSLMDNLGRVDLGYTHTTNQIGENGLRRSVFYGPDAQFYVNLSAYLDGIYDKAASDKKSGATQRVGALPRFSFQ
jgi:hypothetical protein